MSLEETVLREATPEDLPTLVALLADDPLGAQREDPAWSHFSAYLSAFNAIVNDPNHQVLVTEASNRVVGMLQLSFIPHLTYTGGWRAQIEGVRVAPEHRSRGLGTLLLNAAIDRARERGCHLVQLTTDRRRPAALAFYEGHGFEATHDGLKLHLDSGTV